MFLYEVLVFFKRTLLWTLHTLKDILLIHILFIAGTRWKFIAPCQIYLFIRARVSVWLCSFSVSWEHFTGATRSRDSWRDTRWWGSAVHSAFGTHLDGKQARGGQWRTGCSILGGGAVSAMLRCHSCFFTLLQVECYERALLHPCVISCRVAFGK